MTAGAPLARDALSDDAFLGGRLRVLQPKTGYRAATDPVLLAAAVPAAPGEAVLDLGCGVGVAGLCLALRVPGLALWGLELQPAYAALARENALRNGIAATILEGDVARPPAALRARPFDRVLMNPPWFPPAAPPARDPGRDRAQREDRPLAAWIDAGLRRLRPGGTLSVIARAERLGDILAALSGRAGSVAVLPLVSRAGRPAGRVIVTAAKGRRGPLALRFPLVLHEGAEHAGDFDAFTPEASAVLRGGAAIGPDDRRTAGER